MVRKWGAGRRQRSNRHRHLQWRATLLRKKRDQRVVHGRVHVDDGCGAAKRIARPDSDVRGTDVRLLGLDRQPLEYLTTGGEFGQFVFVQELPDIDWGAGDGRGVSLDLSLNAREAEDIVEVLYEMHRLGWGERAATVEHPADEQELAQRRSTQLRRGNSRLEDARSRHGGCAPLGRVVSSAIRMLH